MEEQIQQKTNGETTYDIKSVRINRKKLFLLIWAIVLAIVLILSVISVFQWRHYKKGQDLAIVSFKMFTSQFNKYDKRGELVDALYDYLNPVRVSYTFNGVAIDNKDVVDSARTADKALGKVLSSAGFNCYYGSQYLKHSNYFEYTIHKNMVIWIIVGIAALVATVFNVLYVTDKRELLFSEGSVVAKKRSGKSTQFFLKDITSVESINRNGLKIKGNSINYSITQIKNADDLKERIMKEVSLTQKTDQSLQNNMVSNAEKMKQYKEMLDMGILTQEEYELKKKETLEL